jgi:hypothetical protein
MSFIGSEFPYRDGPREALLRVAAMFPYHDGHGTCFHLHDSSGNVFVWFSKKKIGFEVGALIRANFVIQSHREYEGKKENITKRFRVLEILEEKDYPTRCPSFSRLVSR